MIKMKYQNPEVLNNLYRKEKLSTYQIANKFGVST